MNAWVRGCVGARARACVRRLYACVRACVLRPVSEEVEKVNAALCYIAGLEQRLCIEVCIGIYIDMRIDMGINMCASEALCGHACKHVHRPV